jgi:Tol biopolymer transport system component
MRSKLSSILPVLILISTALACVNPLEGSAIPPANVETIVAGTLQALTSPAPGPGDVPPVQIQDLLPHSMYFLNNDSAGLVQVYRLERNGMTVNQVTSEPANVESYDVSPMDGSVVYVSNNQLLVAGADGSNRRMILDGGPMDVNNPFLTAVRNPIWSPNGQTIAYGFKGLNFYSIASGLSNRVIEDDIDDLGGGLLVPRELFFPDQYSADGSRLILTLGYYEGASAAIYYPNGNALVRLRGGEGALICCGETEWASDGTAFHAANPSMGMFMPGLWRVDSANGNVTTLVSGEAGNGVFNFADEPYLGPDGQLYYFFASLPAGQESVSRVPLQLVRSAPDGVTNRVLLRPESFELMNEALWAPDASFVIAAMAPIQDVYFGGEAELVYTDGQKEAISLVPFAMQLKWGP